LVLPGLLAGKFNFDIYRLAVSNTVSKNIGFAMLTDIHDGSVFCVELTHRVVSCHATVLAQGCDYLVLEFSFGIY